MAVVRDLFVNKLLLLLLYEWSRPKFPTTPPNCQVFQKRLVYISFDVVNERVHTLDGRSKRFMSD